MTEATQPVVLFEMLTPHIALVTLNRPEKRNAISPQVASEMEAIVRKVEADAEVRAVILTSSEDRVFCAGADLGAVASGSGAGMETALGGFAGFVYAQRLKPWIAAVEGTAVAGGMEICLACDMIVGSKNAKFGLPEPKRGLLAGAGGLHRIPGRIPGSVANEMVTTGEPLGAERAYQVGLLNRLTEPGQTVTAAREIAELIAANAPLAVQYSLAASKGSVGLTDGGGREYVGRWMNLLRGTEDFREGPRAFVEKREPVWKGR